MDIQTVLKANYVDDLIARICGPDAELITRPASFMLRNKVEQERDLRRVIILPPRGYTADKLNQTNSHDEAEYATIEIKGSVREGKSGFSILKECLLVVSLPQNNKTSILNKPYMIYEPGDGNPDVTVRKHSAGEAPFAVVKSDGYGFYHNLINLSDDWLVLELYKRLRPQKQVDLEPYVTSLLTAQADALKKFYEAVTLHGDEVFQRVPNLIENIMRMPVEQTLPALSEMLYTHDTGKHEACSVFAVILKIGKMHPDRVVGFMKQAIESKSVPAYYAQQIISKIERFIATEDQRKTA